MTSVERVKAICKERKIPISKLEKDLGFANGYISQLRKGVFPAERLCLIAEYFGVTTDYLLGKEKLEENIISLANGIRVYTSNFPEHLNKMIEDADLEECRVAYKSLTCAVVVENDAAASEEDIAAVISSYKDGHQKAKKEQPIVIDGLSFDNVSKEDIETIKAYLGLPEEQRRALAVILGIVE